MNDHWQPDLALAEAAKPLQDKAYRYIFGDDLNKIIRFSKKEDSRHILDVEYHIDVLLKFNNDISLLGQEKALREKFSSFNTFTIEFYQDRYTKEKGEFFNLGAQFYLHGYLNGNEPDEVTKFKKIYLIKIFDYLEWLKSKPIEKLELKTRPSGKHSKANFYWENYNNIPDRFIYYYWDKNREIKKDSF